MSEDWTNCPSFYFHELPSILGNDQSAFHTPSPAVRYYGGNQVNPKATSNGLVYNGQATLFHGSPADLFNQPGINGENPSISSPCSVNGESSSCMTCVICKDRATGKHYGANSCDGCKGFFRRTIRKNQMYTCRFNRNCVIDKDKRNTCRYCRFQKCLKVGMKREAVQNERDKIRIRPNGIDSFAGKRYPDYITMLLQAEQICTQLRASVITCASAPSTSHVSSFAAVSSQKLATITDISEAIKQQLIILVEWAKALPPFYELPLDDQVALLRSYAAEHLLLGVARRSLPCRDMLLLGNDACIPRAHSTDIHDVNHVVFRLLDEMVEPMRELNPDDTEYVCLKAILFFNPTAQGLLSRIKVKQARFSFLDVLQTYITEQHHQDRLRFGGLLLLLPPLQAMSQQFIENLQLATLFGMCQFDKLLEELLLTATEPLSAPFLVDGISVVAKRMADGLLGKLPSSKWPKQENQQETSKSTKN